MSFQGNHKRGLFGGAHFDWKTYYRPPKRLAHTCQAMDVQPIAWGLLRVFEGASLRGPIRRLNAAKFPSTPKGGWGKIVKEVLLSTFYHPNTDPLPAAHQGAHAGLVNQIREAITSAPAYERLKFNGAYNMRRAIKTTEAVATALLKVLEQEQEQEQEQGGGQEPGQGEEPPQGTPQLSDQAQTALNDAMVLEIEKAAEGSEADEQTLAMFSEGGGLGENCASQMTDEEVSNVLNTMEDAIPRHVLEMLGEFYSSIVGLERDSIQEGLSVAGITACDNLQHLLPDQLALLTHPDPSVRGLHLAEFCDGELLGTLHEDNQPAVEGDFSLLLDASGSMDGADWDIASALGAAAVAIAYRDKREVRGWSFSSEVKPFGLTGDLTSDAQRIFSSYQGRFTDLQGAIKTFLADGGGDALIITDAEGVTIPQRLWKRATEQGRIVIIHVGGDSAKPEQANWTTDHDLYYPLPYFKRGDPKLAEAVAAAFNQDEEFDA